MDSITQAALGATIGGAVLGRQLGPRALFGGALLGTLPDMDVLIDYGSAVANFTQHRGFSHSLLVLVPLALLFAVGLRRWQPRVSLGRWCLFTTLVLVTHPLLDALTTYGTQLLWPWAGPFALSSIFIIDPFYTVPLLVACGVACFRPPAQKALGIGLLVSSLYLGWSLTGQYLITQRVMPVLEEHGLEQAPRLVQPMPFSTFFWRITVMGDAERLELSAGIFGGDDPVRVERFQRNPELEAVAERFPAGQRLTWFSGEFLSYEVREGVLAVTDIRLGLPGAHPFTFGLAVTQGAEWEPVESFQFSRPQLNPQAWRALIRRILGQPIEAGARPPAGHTRPEGQAEERASD